LNWSVFHKPALCQGMTLVVPKLAPKMRGFNPCGMNADFLATIYETCANNSGRPILSAFSAEKVGDHDSR
jgi:hypothetical protein